MVKNQSLNCHSGKQISCEIDSVCIHGDNISSLTTAKSIRDNLLSNGLMLKKLNKMKNFYDDKTLITSIIRTLFITNSFPLDRAHQDQEILDPLKQELSMIWHSHINAAKNLRRKIN